MKPTPFYELVEILEIGYKYECLVEDNKLSVPKKYRGLNDETAHWCIDKLKVFNKKNPALKEVNQLCFTYLEKKAKLNLNMIVASHELAS